MALFFSNILSLPGIQSGEPSGYLVFLLFLLTGIVFSIKSRKLTLPAALTGGVLAVFIFAGAGLTGILMMAAFFVLAVLATSWKRNMKERMGAAEQHKGERTAAQVLANAGLAAFLSLIILVYPGEQALLHSMIAAAFASAAGDTISSELGTVYGRRFYHVLTLRRGQPGCNGVISFEGTLAGLAASLIIALLYQAGYGYTNMLIVVAGGFAGNLVDSFLGDGPEQRGLIGNDVVNFLNTLAAALTACCLYYF